MCVFPPLFFLAVDASCYSFFIFWSCSSVLPSGQSSLRDVSVIKQALRFHICRRKRLKSKWKLPLSLREAGPHVHRVHPQGSHASLKSLSALNNLLKNPAMKPPLSLCKYSIVAQYFRVSTGQRPSNVNQNPDCDLSQVTHCSEPRVNVSLGVPICKCVRSL